MEKKRAGKKKGLCSCKSQQQEYEVSISNREKRICKEPVDEFQRLTVFDYQFFAK